MVKTDWLRLLGYVTGLVNQELLLKNEYLVAENRILKAHIRRRLLRSDGEKATLAEIAKRLGRQALAQIAGVAQPDTILAWFGKLIAKKFDGARSRNSKLLSSGQFCGTFCEWRRRFGCGCWAM